MLFRSVLEIELNPVEALVIGVEPGTTLRVFATPADTLPAEIWDRLVDREPVALRARLDGGSAVDVSLDERPSSTSVAARPISPYSWVGPSSIPRSFRSRATR